MKDSISPEEKLLRLIRGERKKPPVSLPKEVNISIQEKPQPDKTSQKFVFELQKYISRLDTKAFIIIGFIAAVLYLLSAIAQPFFIRKKVSSLAEESYQEAKGPAYIEVDKNGVSATYDFYAQGVKNKQIFGTGSTVSQGEPADVTVGGSFAKDINLLGVISGDNPQAIIEDRKSQKTYYVNKGQMIGELQVTDIRDGKVTLNYGGQVFELSI